MPADLFPRAKDNRFWTLFFNAFRLRCPVCKEGKIFEGWFRIHRTCPECGVLIDREAGYFLGSIYFNYGATCTIAMVVYMIGFFGFGLTNRELVPPIVLFAIFFPLYFLRYARASWLVFDQYFQPREPERTSVVDGDKGK
jgi:uncharacterized protein (DUF983 family)